MRAFEQRASQVGGAEALFEIHSGAEAVGFPVWELALENSFKRALVLGAGCIAGGGSAAVAGGDEFEELGLGLAEALRAEAEGVCARSCGEDAADHVALLRPEMEGAAVVVGAEGVFGGAEVEEDFAVFEDGGGGVFCEEGLDGGDDVRGGLRRGRGRGSVRGHGLR